MHFALALTLPPHACRYELLAIRHCVFVLGAAGSAKTRVWKTLQAAQTHANLGGGPSVSAALNPKAVSSDELYGYVHPSTKVWSRTP